ncbi:MAG: hypothetical protein Q9203_002067 [Teloschistes exilis]
MVRSLFEMYPAILPPRNDTFTLAAPVSLVTQLPLATSAAAQTSLHTTAIASSATARTTSQSPSSHPDNQSLASPSNGVPSPHQSNRLTRDLAIGLGIPLGALGLSLILFLVYKLHQRTDTRDRRLYFKDHGVIEPQAVGAPRNGGLVEVAADVNLEMPLSTDSPLEKHGTNLVEVP